MQDITNSPYWTGGERETLEDGRVARFSRRFLGNEDEAETQTSPEKEGKQGAQKS